MTLRPPPTPSALAAEAIGLIEAGKPKHAARILKDVLKTDPDNFDGLQATAVLRAMDQQYAEAARLLTRALKRHPDFVPALLNLGTAHMMLNQPADAETAFARAAALEPGNTSAHELLGQSRQGQGKLVEAVESYTRAAALDPGNAGLLTRAVAMKQKICDWSGLGPLVQRLVSIEAAAPSNAPAAEPLVMLHLCDDPALLRRNAERHWRTRVVADLNAGKHARRKPLHTRSRSAARPRIRIAYLSADFHQHATAFLMAELFELHDRRQFEVYGFSYGPDDGSAIRQRLTKAFDRFVDVRGVTNEQFAQRIAAAGIDIAIDLKGHTEDARLEVLAMRPAPVQVHYIGFPGTLGGDAIDYLIADRVIAPPGVETHYTERLVRLPGAYQVNDRKRAVADPGPTRQDCGLPDNAVVLCSFNGQQKVTPAMFEIWARVLAAVPNSVLWLYCDHPLAAGNLRREAAARGLDPTRLVIAGKLPPDQHLARQRHADLFLDTLPYNAHTTCSDALWMGLPVLTCPGRAFAGRVAASLLTAMGLPDLIATDLADYETKAISLARDPARLSALRQRLIASRPTAPLFDTTLFTRNLETAYQQMWQRWQRGEPPADIDVAGEVAP